MAFLICTTDVRILLPKWQTSSKNLPYYIFEYRLIDVRHNIDYFIEYIDKTKM